jgi:hypothetical protein
MTPETDLLRRAAARVREVAEAATPGPWTVKPHGSRRNCTTVRGDNDSFLAYYVATPNAAHIALMDPSVALAVADILAGWADDIEQYGGNHRSDDRCVRLARLILEEPIPAPLVREDSHGSWLEERVGGEE